MGNIVINPKARWARISLLLLLPVAVITVMLVGCKTSSYVGISAEQEELIALSKSLPTNSSSDERVALDAGLDSRMKTVHELVHIFMTNRDWTESLPKKELDAWRRTSPYASPPVIIHEKQSDAAFELIQLGPQAKAAAPAMIRSLTNSEFLTRQWALNQKSADISDAQLINCDSLNRHWAIQVLQAIGSASPEVVPALVGELNKHQHETGYKAAEALIVISLTDTNVLPAVIANLESDPETPEAENSVRVLQGIGAESAAAVPVLIRLLERTNACDMVVSTLCAIGRNAAPAVPSLLHRYDQLQGDGNFAQRKWVVITLGRMGPAAKEAVPMLQGLRSRNYESFDAVRALWRIDPEFTRPAISSACAILQAKATPDRPDALGLLGEIGPPARSAVPLLLRVLDAPLNEAIAFNAAWALWRIDPDQKAKVISVMETIRNQEARYPYTDLPVDAAGALWQLEPERRDELRPAILAMLKGWKETPGARIGWAEMKTLQPALADIANNPEYAELHPWAVLARRQINRARAEWWAR